MASQKQARGDQAFAALVRAFEQMRRAEQMYGGFGNQARQRYYAVFARRHRVVYGNRLTPPSEREG